MLMCLERKNAYKSYLSISKNGSFRKRRNNKDTSNFILVQSDHIKLVCDFNSVLRSNYNSVRR